MTKKEFLKFKEDFSSNVILILRIAMIIAGFCAVAVLVDFFYCWYVIQKMDFGKEIQTDLNLPEQPLRRGI